MREPIFLVAALAVAIETPAAAQARDLPVDTSKTWKHKSTGVKFPPAVAGLARNRVSAYTDNDTDVAANYRGADGSDEITFFVYRNVSGNVPLWFDRASSVIRLHDQKYPNARSLGVRPYTPRGQKLASGLIETFHSDGQFQSTGVIVMPVNGHYAKIRASSRTRDPAALEQLLLTAANAFDWSSKQNEASAAPLRDCATPLPQREPAEQAVISSDERQMSALVGGLLSAAAVAPPTREQVEFCREPGRTQIAYGIYRPGGTTDGYVMALQDAGRAIAVGDSLAAAIFAEQGAAPRVSVSLIELDETSAYGEFATLPLPEQVLALIESSDPLSVTSTLGKARNIVINTAE